MRAVGEEERARELLGEGAAALRQPAAAEVAPGRAAERDGVEAGVAVEAVVLDRHHRVPQVRARSGQRHVAALLVQGEPGPAVGAVEDGVAHAAGQLVDGPHRRPSHQTPATPATAWRASRAATTQSRRPRGLKPIPMTFILTSPRVGADTRPLVTFALSFD